MIRYLLAALQALTASAALSDTPQALADAARAWAEDYDVPGLAIAVTERGVVQPTDADSTRRVDMASLSKAITAVCAGTLIDEGMWSARTTSAAVLGFGHEGITVADLITHSAGLMPDSTQRLTPLWMTSAAPRKRIVTEVALNRARDGAGRYQYNNENYAILGEMIETALATPYEDACRLRALDPAGVRDARAAPVMGGMLPWGGWAMSPADYARFHAHWFGPKGRYASGGAISIDVGGGARYGMGMFFRSVQDHVNHWHFGAWCLPGRVEAGSYAVQWQNRWGAVVTYDACVEWDAMRALDAALVAVVYPQ
ncbi:beta-lactamase family protein [Sulfitobacter albidus]|uniref:Beta-lactamase family protein n=1 Tax=Sulfitobacter albidus TaxID=2829501 RepID=A0A975JEM2_9RHOB|nr:serine hydrolase domain-containing protein [Sulfitobacter albidus]QUJ77079.1 beta-lactamase family protein [Sulfitobacter albidus]